MLLIEEKKLSRRSKCDHEIIEMPNQRMAVVYTKGDPNVVGHNAISALYGSVYTLKFDLKKRGLESFKVGTLRARWPDFEYTPKYQWTGVWGLPIPEGITSLPQKDPTVEVEIEDWKYGTVARILHVGPYSAELATVERLHDFIREEGYEVAGPHEEQYLTTPDAKVQRTIILYPVRRMG